MAIISPIEWWKSQAPEYVRRNRPTPESFRARRKLVLRAYDIAREMAGTPHPRVLELGCADGWNLAIIANERQPHLLCGIDASWDAMRGFQGPAPEHLRDSPLELTPSYMRDRILLRQAEIPPIPHPTQSFDIILSIGFLIHIPPDQIERTIREMWRVGRVLIVGEYEAVQDEQIKYREDGVLWKRPYRVLLETYAPGPVVGEGWMETKVNGGFDDMDVHVVQTEAGISGVGQGG